MMQRSAGWHRTRNVSAIIGFSAWSAIAAGCGARYKHDAEAMMHAYLASDIEAALSIASRQAESADRRDALVWWLEQGALARAAGDLYVSEEAFAHADSLIAQFDQEPEVKLTDETGAVLSNLTALPYRGRGYDRIMLSTYRALNALTLGEFEAARVELNRAFSRQRQAIERNRARIEAAEEDARQARASGMLASQTTMPAELEQLDDFEIRFADLYLAQGEYVNPFTEFLQGLYFLFASESVSDIEMGRHALERVTAMTGGMNPHADEDYLTAVQIASGNGFEPMTYVIFETGRAPSRDQVTLHLPLPVRGVDYVGAAFPTLVFHGGHERYLIIEHEGGTTETAPLVDMDTIVGLEFRNELPAVVTRTLITAASQGAMHYGLHAATRDDDLLNIAVRLASIGYRAAQTQADRRTWHTLPKQIQYGRVLTPADRRLIVRTPTGTRLPVMIEDGEINVVHVKSIVAGGPIRIWQFRLR